MAKVIARPAEISTEDCTAIVSRKLNRDDVPVLDHKLLPMEEKSGFLGEHFRLVVTVSDEEKRLEFFAKFLPGIQSQIDFVLSTGAFTKEIFIYQRFFRDVMASGFNCLQTCVPHCYFTRENHVLVFENLLTEGYKTLPKFNFLDYEHLEVVVKSLAVMHAASLVYEEKKGRRIIDLYPDRFDETFYSDRKGHKGGHGLYASSRAIKTEIDMMYEELNIQIPQETFKQRAFDTVMNMLALAKPSDRYRSVVCHGDLWCTNLLMKYKNDTPSQCMIVDFQTARYKSPAHDLMGLIYLTTSREFRIRYSRQLESVYYTELSKCLKANGCDLATLISPEAFWESCEAEKMFAVPQRATYFQLTQVRPEIIAEFSQDNEKWNEALYKDRSSLVVESCKRDPHYRSILKETLLDLADICQ